MFKLRHALVFVIVFMIPILYHVVVYQFLPEFNVLMNIYVPLLTSFIAFIGVAYSVKETIKDNEVKRESEFNFQRQQLLNDARIKYEIESLRNFKIFFHEMIEIQDEIFNYLSDNDDTISEVAANFMVKKMDVLSKVYQKMKIEVTEKNSKYKIFSELFREYYDYLYGYILSLDIREGIKIKDLNVLEALNQSAAHENRFRKSVEDYIREREKDIFEVNFTKNS